MAVIINLICSMLELCLRGYVISKLWLWFVVSIFTGINPLSVGAAIGLSLLISVIQRWKTLTNEETATLKQYKPEDTSRLIITNFFIQVVIIITTLGTGWFIHSIM
jgi:hypothetical protein